MVRAGTWRVTRTAARCFPAGFGRASRGAQRGEKSGKGAACAAGRQVPRCERAFPGQALVGDEGPGEPELHEREPQQPGPAVGGSGVSRAYGGPAEGLFEEPEAVPNRVAYLVTPLKL